MAAVEPGATIGQYRILEVLGTGGMATVYKAVHTALNRTVAVKVLDGGLHGDDPFMERFLLEARNLASLHHPHILEIYDFDEQDGNTYIVMEYVEGGTLASRLTAPLPFESLARIVDEVASALDYAHARGILHRDVKPSNILLRLDQTAVVADFGLSKIVAGDSSLTRVGTVVGTPEYMSPEQAMGQPVDARSDVYGLGATLYHLLVGRVPYSRTSPLATIVAHLHEPLPSPRSINPSIPREVEDVVTRALAKDPKDRYASAGDLARALIEALRQSGKIVSLSGAVTGAFDPSPVGERGAPLTRSIVTPATPPPAARDNTAPAPRRVGTSQRPKVKPVWAAAAAALVLLAIPAGVLWRNASDTGISGAAPRAPTIAPGLADVRTASPTLAAPEVIPTAPPLVGDPTSAPTSTPEPEPTATTEPEPTSPPPTAIPPTSPPPPTRPPPTAVPTRLPPTAVPPPPPTAPPIVPTAAGPAVLPMGEDPSAPPPPRVITPQRLATPPPGVEIGPMGASTPITAPQPVGTVPALIMGEP